MHPAQAQAAQASILPTGIPVHLRKNEYVERVWCDGRPLRVFPFKDQWLFYYYYYYLWFCILLHAELLAGTGIGH